MNYKHIALVTLVGLLIGTTATARDFGKSGDRLANALDLDEAQVEAIEEIFANHREQVQAELEAVLTAEQLEEYNSLREERRDGRRGRNKDQDETDA